MGFNNELLASFSQEIMGKEKERKKEESPKSTRQKRFLESTELGKKLALARERLETMLNLPEPDPERIAAVRAEVAQLERSLEVADNTYGKGNRTNEIHDQGSGGSTSGQYSRSSSHSTEDTKRY